MKRHNSIIKMTITNDNYEFYALDYLEGNLDATTQKAMDAFLQKHPELQAEMEDMQEFVVLEAEEELVFEKKASLKKALVSDAVSSKGAFVLPVWLRYAAAAAIILGLIFGVTQLTRPGQVSKEIKLVEQKNPTPPKSEKTTILPPTENDHVADLEIVEELAKQERTPQKRETKPRAVVPVEPMEKEELVVENQATQEKIKLPEEIKPIVESEPLKEKVLNKQRAYSTESIAAIDTDVQVLAFKTAQRNAVVEMSLLHESQLLVEALSTPPSQKAKQWKTPFGTIKWKEVANALTPESYFASK